MGLANAERTVRDGWLRCAGKVTLALITKNPAWIGVGQTDFNKGTSCDNPGTTKPKRDGICGVYRGEK